MKVARAVKSGVSRPKADPAPGRRRGVVLDLETAPDRHAQGLSRRGRVVPRGSPIHEIVNASVLAFAEETDGSIGRFDLRSWHRDEYGEADILMNVEAALHGVAEDSGRVVTFNGDAHDLPTLRMRQVRWWLCEADAVERIQSGDAEHMDVMLSLSGGGRSRWPSLSDACASVGFSLFGPNGVGRTSRTPQETQKCELDVVGTAILMFYVLGAARRSREPLERGLPALGRYIRSIAANRPHLERFALSRLLAEDARAWGASAA